MIPCCDYYCDMMYLLPYSSFTNLPPEEKTNVSEEASSTIYSVDTNNVTGANTSYEDASLLDLYSGCGAIWAVDLNEYAYESLQWNHPETAVRNESAENFLALLREWERLCVSFSLLKSEKVEKYSFDFRMEDDGTDEANDGADEGDGNDDEGKVFEVEKILAIRFGDPEDEEKRGLYFQILVVSIYFGVLHPDIVGLFLLGSLEELWAGRRYMGIQEHI
ncbi:hypothetical protein REPUB_Repub04eG0141500 [Reevesia pubescens]